MTAKSRLRKQLKKIKSIKEKTDDRSHARPAEEPARPEGRHHSGTGSVPRFLGEHGPYTPDTQWIEDRIFASGFQAHSVEYTWDQLISGANFPGLIGEHLVEGPEFPDYRGYDAAYAGQFEEAPAEEAVHSDGPSDAEAAG